MKFLTLTAIAAFSIGLISSPTSAQQMASAQVINNDQERVGEITLTQGPKGVLIYADLQNLPAGKHGFHIHEVGTCEDHESFTDSKGHIGKGEDVMHGLLNPEGYEEGDLPNLIVAENGEVEVELYATDLKITADDGNIAGDEVILDADGAAFMIHENADDHMTQPIGGAGARIACGVIQMSSTENGDNS
jgi:Cu-Zn family superoxide dismutase